MPELYISRLLLLIHISFNQRCLRCQSGMAQPEGKIRFDCSQTFTANTESFTANPFSEFHSQKLLSFFCLLHVKIAVRCGNLYENHATSKRQMALVRAQGLTTSFRVKLRAFSDLQIFHSLLYCGTQPKQDNHSSRFDRGRVPVSYSATVHTFLGILDRQQMLGKCKCCSR